MSTAEITIAEKTIGNCSPCFIIAEAGVNHNGSFNLACKLIDAAQEAGADAVKFQTWLTEKLVSNNAVLADYQAGNGSRFNNQYDLLKSLELSFDDFRRLKRYADDRNIIFLSTPDEETSADFLADLGVPLFKIGSAELDNISFMQHVARFGRPMIVSTGMSTLREVQAAVAAIRECGNEQLILLQCTSDYPAKPVDCNLRAMRTLEENCMCPTGFSDHTLGNHIAVAAVALGACVLEKHITTDRSLPGPDHKASTTPSEFKTYVARVRETESALGTGVKAPAGGENKTRDVVRKKLVAACDLGQGHLVVPADVELRRAGGGFALSLLGLVVGRRLKTCLKKGAPFRADILE